MNWLKIQFSRDESKFCILSVCLKMWEEMLHMFFVADPYVTSNRNRNYKLVLDYKPKI